MSLPRVQQALVVAGLSLAITACGTNPYSLPKIESPEPDYEDSTPQAEPAPKPPAGTPRPQPVGAASGLLAKAESARGRGDYDQAMAYLERAQRIDPDNAAIYLGLAQTHAAAGNMIQARATAERGLLYCSGSAQCDALRAYTR